jgi:hypothetical protein
VRELPALPDVETPRHQVLPRDEVDQPAGDDDDLQHLSALE